MFIQIGNKIINKAHIVSVEVKEVLPESIEYEPYPKLTITITGTQPGDYGQYPATMTFYRAEATALWEQLQHYLAPTVIQIA